MDAKGVSAPMSAPSDFPGKRNASAPLEDGLVLVWTPTGRLGLRIAVAGRRGESTDRLLLPKKPIGLVDAATIAGEAWAVFTRDPEEPGDAATAWGIHLPDGEPFPITTAAEADVSELKLIPGGDRPLAAVVDLDGSLAVYGLRDGAAELCWRVG